MAHFLKNILIWAVVVKWSVCSPSTPTIRVRILLTPTVSSVKFVFDASVKNEFSKNTILVVS